MGEFENELARVFDYNESTGLLTWKAGKFGRGCIEGKEAGSVKVDGRYRTVVLDGKRYYTHRIAWEIAVGHIPDGMCIDHINGNGLDNRLKNLRVTTLSSNQRNRRLNRNCMFGIHGVHPKKVGFAVHCAGIYIKYTKDFFEACCLRKAAELRNGFHENHGRRA